MKKTRILIVEDETIIAMGIESKLQGLGYEVTSIVNNGADAIEKAEEDKPDLILMDIRIKGEMDGIDTAEIIRNKFGIPVIFSTAYLDEGRIERAKITMPFGYVLKPIQDRDLKVTLEMALYIAKANAELKIGEKIRRLATVVIDSNDAVTVQDFGGNIVSWNKGAEKMFGYTETEALKMKSAVIVPKDKAEEALVFVKKMQEEEEVESFETQRLNKNGKTIDVWLTATKLLDEHGIPNAFATTERDITERKRTEADLRRLATVVLDSNDAITIMDFDGNILAWNKGSEKMYGYTEVEALQKKIFDIVPENKKDEELAFVKTLREEEKVESFETQRKTKDGRILDVWLTVTKLVDHNGKTTAIATTERDITEHKQAEDELLKYRDHLEDLVKERTVKLEAEITERKEIEARLEKTRKELEIIKKSADEAHEFADSVINTVREPLISLDQDLRVVTVSRSFYDFFKVKPEETVGQLIYDLGNKQWDIPKLRKLLETILPEKTAFDNYEVEHDFATIGRRTMLLNARQIERAMGEERIILLAIEDITERKQAEDALRASERRLKLSVESGEIGLWELDLIDHTACRSFLHDRIFGYETSLPEWTYEMFLEHVVVEDRPTVSQKFDEAMTKSTVWDFECRIRRKDGIVRWIWAKGNLELSVQNEPVKIIGVVQDITERKEKEAGLEKARKELEIIKKSADEAHEFADSIINTVREPLISLDQDLRVVTVSRSFYDFFKVKPEETVGKLIYDLGNKQWDIPKLRKLLETILPEKTAFDNYEVEHDFATIGRRTMRLNARQIEQTMGKERIILLAIEDITERKQTEKQIKASLKEKETLLQEIHHRVKNNMTVIFSLLELQRNSTDNPIAKEALQDSQNRVHSMALVHETLYRSDILSAIDLKTYLSELGRTIIQNYSIGKKVQFNVEAKNIMVSVKQASPVGLIVNELIANCLKYAFSDGREGEILLELKSNKKNGVELSVSDNGIGLPESFDLKTADSLGLKLVKMLAENQLGGSIDMESNKGTKFTIKFNIDT